MHTLAYYGLINTWHQRPHDSCWLLTVAMAKEDGVNSLPVVGQSILGALSGFVHSLQRFPKIPYAGGS